MRIKLSLIFTSIVSIPFFLLLNTIFLVNLILILTGGLKELNVFVDLASMSAGETDIEVDRAQVLHSAATGYAPLIFSLNETCNDMEFIELCETVWKELETDKKLPKKLVCFVHFK